MYVYMYAQMRRMIHATDGDFHVKPQTIFSFQSTIDFMLLQTTELLSAFKEC